MKKSLESVLDNAALQALAGDVIYRRGEGYQGSGMVLDLKLVSDKLRGRVDGTATYKVALWQERGRLQCHCSCPMGEDGACCKHVVALGLEWLQQTPEERQQDVAVSDGIRTFLEAQDKARLVDLLLEQSEQDPVLHVALQVRAQTQGNTADRHAVLRTISNVLGGRRFVQWDEVSTLVKEAEAITELLELLLQGGHHALAAEAADHALELGIRRYQTCDDSGGSFGDFLRDIAALHLQACRAAQTDYHLTAKQLLKQMRADEWGLLALQDYAPLLAPKEYQRYRKLVMSAWQKLPTLPPAGSKERTWQYSPDAARMEAVAEYEKDVDLLVTVLSRDLSSAYRFLRIAEVLLAARRRNEAVAWAERGLASFRDGYDGRLVDFLVTAYAKGDDRLKAAALQERYFRAQPSLDAWKKLKSLIKPAKAWTALRGELLLTLERAMVERARKTGADRYSMVKPVLVEILLWEKDTSEALRVAKAHGAAQDQWLRLAALCEPEFPHEAIDIYQRYAHSFAERRNNDGYDAGKELVAKVRGLMRGLGDGKAFNAWLLQLRTEHKAKRNFIARLEKVKELPESGRR